jgi:hypothetical protein
MSKYILNLCLAFGTQKKHISTIEVHLFKLQKRSRPKDMEGQVSEQYAPHVGGRSDK